MSARSPRLPLVESLESRLFESCTAALAEYGGDEEKDARRTASATAWKGVGQSLTNLIKASASGGGMDEVVLRTARSLERQ